MSLIEQERLPNNWEDKGEHPEDEVTATNIGWYENTQNEYEVTVWNDPENEVAYEVSKWDLYAVEVTKDGDLFAGAAFEDLLEAKRAAVHAMQLLDQV